MFFFATKKLKMETFEKIKVLLNGNNVIYQHKKHAPTLTSEEAARVRGDALSSGAKAIVYKIEKQFYLFVFAADRKMNPKKIKTYFKEKGMKAKKSRFASSEELFDMTGLVPGSVPPFGQPILNFDLFVDPSLKENERISFNAGSLTNSISMNLEDYINVAKPEVFEFVD